MMMNEYGIDNVRGGSFSSIVLSDWELKAINKMIQSTKNQCYNCGSNDHYILECKQSLFNNNLKIILMKIIKMCNIYDKNFVSKIKINIYLEIIKFVDPIIFKNIDTHKLKKLCGNQEFVNYYKLTNKIFNIINQNY